jgi:Secretion system C-terminal sorting domain
MKKRFTLYLFTLSALSLIYSSMIGSIPCKVYDRHVIFTTVSCNTSSCHYAVHVYLDSNGLAQLDTSGRVTGGGGYNPTGIIDLKALKNIDVYPAVTTGDIHIRTYTATANMSYQVYSLTGQMILQGGLPAYPSTITLDIKDANSSIYLVSITSGSESITRKVVKQ